jgi:hypothetical protein
MMLTTRRPGHIIFGGQNDGSVVILHALIGARRPQSASLLLMLYEVHEETNS